MTNFKKLNVWQIAKNLAVKVYKLTNSQPLSKDYGLKDQLQRAAVGIASNIAEGDESGSDKQSIRHFYIAKGSSAELMTQLIIAEEIDYIDFETKENLCNDCDKISAMLSKLIKARTQMLLSKVGSR